jgi:hypothetical protein
VTQCYAIRAMRELARLCALAGDDARAARWSDEADLLASTFRATFWLGDHFAEYVHPQRGVVDVRGLSDVDWAAIGLGVASDKQASILWPLLTHERAFWHGGMPTQLNADPFHRPTWEEMEELPFEHQNGHFYDIAAMGRVWYLESLACRRMKDARRLVESARLVCQMGERHGWQWHERYHAKEDDTVTPAGPAGYCEYAAVLVRIVLGNSATFS